MKKMSYWMSVAIFICSLMMAGFSSCSFDNPVSENDEDSYFGYDLSDLTFLESGEFSVIDILWDIFYDHSDMDSEEDRLYAEWADEQLKSLLGDEYMSRRRAGEELDGEWGFAFENRLKYVTIRYKTTGANGEEKELSELIGFDAKAGSDETKNPQNLIIGCHATITSNAERPTNFKNLDIRTDVAILNLMACERKAVVVIPDYEGYGATSSDPHPYCSREITAKQMIDGAKAAVAWFEENVTKMPSGWKSTTVGYSQGGAVAASVLEYYHAHNEKGLNIVGAVCGDGPYDPLATLKKYIEDDRLYMPVAPALLLKGMVDTDKNMMALGCTYQDFVTDKFYDTGIFDWLQSKEFTTVDIHNKLLDHSAKYGGESGFTMMAMNNGEFKAYTPENIKETPNNWKLRSGQGENYCTVDQCFKPGVIEYFKSGKITGEVSEAKLKALEQALKENSLTYDGWMPSGAYPHGFYFFHAIHDEVVPFCNYESVKNAWGTNLFMGEPKDFDWHVTSGGCFYLFYALRVVEEILNEKWVPGEK